MKKWRTFVEARKFVHSLKLKSGSDWTKYYKSKKRPSDIPTTPRRVYKKEWISMGNWLGTGRVAHQVTSANYLPWSQAKIEYPRLAKEYGLNGRADWRKFAKSHKKLLKKLRIPVYPWRVYTKERVWRKMKDD